MKSGKIIGNVERKIHEIYAFDKVGGKFLLSIAFTNKAPQSQM